MRELKAAATIVVTFTLALGLVYPLVMTGVSQVVFPGRAGGEQRLLGREYAKDLFQARPSVTGYSAAATFFNNQGPNQRDLAGQLSGYVKAYVKREGAFTPGLKAADVPADAVTTSASGVDPDISERNARIQANRVARERGLDLELVLELVKDHASRPLFGLAGPRSINVHDLNAAVEASR